MLQKTKKRILKYSLFGFGLLAIPLTLISIYFIEREKINRLSRIGVHTYWNTTKKVWTKEGYSPILFWVDLDRVTEEDKQKYQQHKLLYPEHQESKYYDATGIAYSYFNYIDYSNYPNSTPKWITKNITKTTYLIKSEEGFIKLLQTKNPTYYSEKTQITSEFNELLNNIDFNKQDLLILNNYNSQIFARSDNREKKLNINDLIFDKDAKKLKISFSYNDKYNFYILHNDAIYASNTAVGSNNWFKTYFLIIDKSDATSPDDLYMDFVYK
ncbi:hypothetical protein MBVR141_0217 [Mycoplasmopsis bovirhinis]|uniref:Uncharacterized protein n=1 Tax=Mycoplasmopsis bovirhinis TaxID=29553 RepID=A0A224ARX1_9BACT|nr:hypothetical protein [Mycoplasmopsis bovirhinis]BBA22179.1 hypothetical protein MBVR141_0217 [Mycoplasmopsis bovirhinis]VEU63262.1 Uncharacterised protein [Mycoplasmopsis bovirhinis]